MIVKNLFDAKSCQIYRPIAQSLNNTFCAKVLSEELMSSYSEKPWLKNYDFWVNAETTYPKQPLYRILQLATGLYGDRPATAFLGAQLTFRELKDQVDRFATALSRLGIVKGDRVGIMFRTRRNMSSAFLPS